MGLFDSIRRVVGGGDTPSEPDNDDTSELVDLRDADVEQLREQAEAVADATDDLDFSLASLARLDAAVDRWYDATVPTADDQFVYPIDAVRLGCYLGEVLARVFDGTWNLDPLGVVIAGPDGRRTVAVFDLAIQSMTETSVFGGVAALVASEVGFADISRERSDSDTDTETSLSGLTAATDTADPFAEDDTSAESDLPETDERVPADQEAESDATVGSASGETLTEDTDDAVSPETDDEEVPAVDDEPAGDPSEAGDVPTDSDEDSGDELTDEGLGETGDGLTDEELGELKETVSEETVAENDTVADTDDNGTQADETADTQPDPEATLTPPVKPTFESVDTPPAQIPTPPVTLPERDDEGADAEAMSPDASRENHDADLSTEADDIELTEFDAVTGTASADDSELEPLVEFDPATEDETEFESDGSISRSADSDPEATTEPESSDSSTAQSSADRDRTTSLPRTIGETQPIGDWISHANLPVTQGAVASVDRDEETFPRFEPADRHHTRDPLCLPRLEPSTDPAVRDNRTVPRLEPSPRGESLFPHFAPAVGIQDRSGPTLPRFDAIADHSRSDPRVLPQFIATGERRDDDRFVYPQFQPSVGAQHPTEPVLPQFEDIEASRIRQSPILPRFESTTDTRFRENHTVPRFRSALEPRHTTEQVIPRFESTDGGSWIDSPVVPRFTAASAQPTNDRIVPMFEPATTTLRRDGRVLPRIEPVTADRNRDRRVSPRFEPGEIQPQPSVEDALSTPADGNATAVAAPEEPTTGRNERSAPPDRPTDDMALLDAADEPTTETATDTLGSERSEYAETAEEFVSIWTEYDLDYTPGSLGSLDDLAATEWTTDRFEDATYGSEETYDDQAFTSVVTELGSYFGEVLARELDGEWSDETGTEAVVVNSPEEKLAIPVFRIAETSLKQQPVFTRSYEALLDDLGLTD